MLGQGNLGELALGQIGGSEFPLPLPPTFIRNAAAILDRIRGSNAILYQARSGASVLDRIRSTPGRLTE